MWILFFVKFWFPTAYDPRAPGLAVATNAGPSDGTGCDGTGTSARNVTSTQTAPPFTIHLPQSTSSARSLEDINLCFCPCRSLSTPASSSKPGVLVTQGDGHPSMGWACALQQLVPQTALEALQALPGVRCRRRSPLMQKVSATSLQLSHGEAKCILGFVGSRRNRASQALNSRRLRG